METTKEKELTDRMEALEAKSEKHLQTLDNTVELMGKILDLQGRVLAWAVENGFEEID